MLAVGQVMGSIMAGTLIDNLNYTTTFVIYGVIGLLALLIYPTVNVKPSKVDETQKYTKMQKKNKEVLGNKLK